jgi:hypothetical protein
MRGAADAPWQMPIICYVAAEVGAAGIFARRYKPLAAALARRSCQETDLGENEKWNDRERF